ncbi:MAG: hypothetical protein D3904_12730 [Candidatus Electrothrix sp. EH2]|nr:hypothetical protein [Candidatus Electrothrix sp. EH2]
MSLFCCGKGRIVFMKFDVQAAHESDADALHLRVRGMKAVRFAATMKATALNIIRAAAYKSEIRGKVPLHPPSEA